MEKISHAQLGQMFKTAADTIRTFSEENQQLKEKVAAFEKKERAEKIALAMEEKGLQPELTYQDKVAGLLRRENLDVVEEAVGFSAPQTKFASVHDADEVTVEGNTDDRAADAFVAALANS